MKATLFATFVALLMVGCGSPDSKEERKPTEEFDRKYGKFIAEAIDMDKRPDGYTGWAKRMYMHDDGLIRALGQFKDGRNDGLWTWWYRNGQKDWEETYKDGKLVTAVGWMPNGGKSETNVVNGNGVRVVYNLDGMEIGRNTFKDGEAVTWELVD